MRLAPMFAEIFGGPKLPLVFALLAPLLAGVIVVSFEDSLFGRVASRLAMFLAAAGAGLALARSLMGDEVAWQGFAADAWRALLASGALLTACAFNARGSMWSRGAIAVSGGAGAAAIFAPDALWLGVLLPATTAAYAAAAYTVSDEPAIRLPAMRSTVALVVADLAAVLGLILGASEGLTLPPSSDAAAALLLAAGAIRLGLVASATEDGLAAGLGAGWLGPVRAQGALLAGFAVSAGGPRATILAGLGTAVAAGAAWRAFRERSSEPLATVAAGVVAAGLGLGGPAGAVGAVLALAGSFAAWPLWLARRTEGASVTTFALAPAGATFAGAVMIASSALQASAVKPAFLPIAVGLLIAAPLTAVAAWRARDPEWAGEAELLWVEPAEEPEEVPVQEEATGIPVFEAEGSAPASDYEVGAVTPSLERIAPSINGGGSASSEPPVESSTEHEARPRDEEADESSADVEDEVVVVVRSRAPLRLLWAVEALWVAASVLVIAALIAQPERVRSFVAVPAAAILGAGKLLGPDPFGVHDTLGVIMGVLAILGLAAASGEREAVPVPAVAPPRWGRWWLAPAPVTATTESVRRWGLVAAVAGAATVGLAARLLLVAGSRGFL